MKSCILVNYWADTQDKIDVVVNCITQLKKTGKEVFYSSVIPVVSEIQKVSDYVLFDTDNPIIFVDDELQYPDLEIYNTFHYDTGQHVFYSKELNFVDVQYSLLHQIQKNLKFIKELGYTHVHFFHGDNILNDDDFPKLIHMEETCDAFKKKAIFEDTEHGYRTLYFFTDIDFFLENSGTYTSKHDFIIKNKHHWGNLNFELYIKSRFEPLKNHTLVCDLGILSEDGAITMFRKSKNTIDLYSSYNAKTKFVLVPNKEKTNMDFFICARDSNNYKIYKNNTLILETNTVDNGWDSRNLPIEPFLLSIYKNDKKFFEIDLTKQKLNKICNCISFYK
jgi:hypothetical protein